MNTLFIEFIIIFPLLLISFKPMTQAPQSYKNPLPNTLYTPNNNRPSFKTLDNPNLIFSNKVLEHINCIEEPSKQYGGLYIGDIISIVKPNIIENHKITAVLSCLHQNNYSSNLPSSVAKKTIPAKDNMDYPINLHFQEAFNFIQTMRKANRNVLVHCHAGVSRSAAIVCAYLMKKSKWTLDQTLNFVKQRRNRVKPNQNFIKILREYESVTNRELGKNNQRNSVNCTQSYNKPTGSSLNPRNSLEFQPERRFLYSIENEANRSEKQKMNKSFNESKKEIKRKNSVCDINSLSFHEKGNENGRETKEKVNLKKSKAVHKQMSFGQQFKNKISALLGRKTRIPWELNQKNRNIEFEDNQISLNCF